MARQPTRALEGRRNNDVGNRAISAANPARVAKGALQMVVRPSKKAEVEATASWPERGVVSDRKLRVEMGDCSTRWLQIQVQRGKIGKPLYRGRSRVWPVETALAAIEAMRRGE